MTGADDEAISNARKKKNINKNSRKWENGWLWLISEKTALLVCAVDSFVWWLYRGGNVRRKRRYACEGRKTTESKKRIHGQCWDTRLPLFSPPYLKSRGKEFFSSFDSFLPFFPCLRLILSLFILPFFLFWHTSCHENNMDNKTRQWSLHGGNIRTVKNPIMNLLYTIHLAKC